MIICRPVISALCGIRGSFTVCKTFNLQPKVPDSFKISAASYAKFSDPENFLKYNQVLYPPLEPGEEPRPAFVCHQKVNIKYQQKKLQIVAALIRGMSVEEAIKQLQQVPRKGAFVIIDTLKEAQEIALKEHNVEFRSNLWVAESFTGKGLVMKGVRRHAKGRMGEIRYMYSHYFVRLEEGTPPKRFYWDLPRDGPSSLERYISTLRKRKIINSL